MNAEKQLNQEQQMVPSPAEALPAEKPASFVQATKDFFGNALNTVKGKDLSTLVEEFSSEMTLVAEGLSEDQAKLHELCQSVAAQQTVDREELDQTIRQVSQTVANANERIGALETGVLKLQKTVEQIEKKAEEKKKNKMDTLSGIIRQLTVLVGVAGGAWIIVTILKLIGG